MAFCTCRRFSACVVSDRARRIHDLVDHFGAAMRGQAVEKHGVRRGLGHQCLLTWNGAKIAARASASSSWPMLAHTSV